MHALITGGCGFVGSNLALPFRSAGWEVTCFDTLMRRGSELTLRRVMGPVPFVHGDVRNRKDLDRWMAALIY
jgi:CDP-paratose 2-epimerase